MFGASPAPWHGREILPFALLDALIEKALEHITQELIVTIRMGQSNILPHLQNFQKYFGILVKKLLVVNINQ